jgi:signal transduction histidine kinase
MHLSIRVRMVLAMNLLVAAVGVVVGYAGIEVATRQIERKLIGESAENAARLIGQRNWPLDSDALMSQVAEILGAETASGDMEGRGIVSSSLPASRRAELAGQLTPARTPASVVLGTERYRLGTAVVRRVSASGARQQRRFYLLVLERRLLAAQRRVAGRIALFTLLAVVLATAVGFWLSTSLTRPVRKLADRMDHLAAGKAADGFPDAPAGLEADPARRRRAPPAEEHRGKIRPAGLARGPSELVRLNRSFDDLVGRLAAARQQLERSARLAALGQLAASVAHELRNPLSGIRMNARVLADELRSGGRADRSLDLIIREIERMDLYLQELLSLASASPIPEPGKAPAAEAPTQPVRLDELADSVVALLAGRCEHAGVTVHTDYAADAPPALAEPARIRQVLLNLVLNALEAMPHGGTLRLGTRRAGANAVRLEVADSGPGVHARPGADIFEPFVSSKPQGTGLGLYVCRRAVEGLGGRIGYQTTPQGATFWFELPAAT